MLRSNVFEDTHEQNCKHIIYFLLGEDAFGSCSSFQRDTTLGEVLIPFWKENQQYRRTSLSAAQ